MTLWDWCCVIAGFKDIHQWVSKATSLGLPKPIKDAIAGDRANCVFLLVAWWAQSGSLPFNGDLILTKKATSAAGKKIPVLGLP